jgi:hypothetical protein
MVFKTHSKAMKGYKSSLALKHDTQNRDMFSDLNPVAARPAMGGAPMNQVRVGRQNWVQFDSPMDNGFTFAKHTPVKYSPPAGSGFTFAPHIPLTYSRPAIPNASMLTPTAAAANAPSVAAASRPILKPPPPPQVIPLGKPQAKPSSKKTGKPSKPVSKPVAAPNKPFIVPNPVISNSGINTRKADRVKVIAAGLGGVALGAGLGAVGLSPVGDILQLGAGLFI